MNTTTPPKVSIIVAVYNYGKYIKDALQSIISQSFTDYEVIVIDDGSTDDTATVVQGWMIPFEGKLKYFYQKNQGVAAARNHGILRANGEFIAFLDADDAWFWHTLHTLVSYMELKPDCGVVYANVQFYDITLEKVLGCRFYPQSPLVPYSGKCFDKLFVHGNFIHTSATLVRRSVFEKVGLYDHRFKCGEDLDMWIRVSAIFEIKYINEVLAKIRDHAVGLSLAFLSAHKASVLMVPKFNKLIPHFEDIIGQGLIKKKLYESYYTIGIYSILEKKNKRGLLWLRKARKIDPNPFKNKIIFYFVLGNVPFLSFFKKFRATPKRFLSPKSPEKIKVLHIIKTLNMGGAESNLFNLVRSLDNNNFEVHVAYSSQGELEGMFEKNRIKLFKFSDSPHKLKSFASVRIILRLMGYIKKEKIKIIHTHSFNAHIWGGIAAKLAGCKIIEHVHDSRYIDPHDFELRGEQNQQYRFIKFLRNFSDRVVVLTRQNYNFIMKHRLHKKERVSEIKNGIDLKAIRHLTDSERICLKEKLGIAPDASIVLTPIRFSKEKNLNVLFQIALDVTRALPQAVCVIAGTGPEKENFEAKVRSYHLEDRIKTIGFYADIPQLLAISDVFLLPSTIELHSIAIMEAMRQKVPVVVSRNVGCNDEFIRDGENGILLDPFTREGWAHAIVALLQDNELRRRMGEAGFKTLVEKFDIKDIARKFEHIYESLLFV